MQMAPNRTHPDPEPPRRRRLVKVLPVGQIDHGPLTRRQRRHGDANLRGRLRHPRRRSATLDVCVAGPRPGLTRSPTLGRPQVHPAGVEHGVESLLTPGGTEDDEELDETPVVMDPDFPDFAADAGVVEETEDAVETDTGTEDK